MDIPNPPATQVAEAILQKSKYRNILPEFIESLAAEELAKGEKSKDAIKEVASKLHQVSAAYQTGLKDYSAWKKEMGELPADLQSPHIKEFCLSHMQKHSSTQERLPIIEEFFNSTLAEIAPVASILDLACGLNPLAVAWMPLAKNAAYYGCDIYCDLTDFLNQFISHFGIDGSFKARDITCLKFPHRAQVAFLLKTLPCLEQLHKGISLPLMDAIPADYLLVSYPIRSLGGRAKGMGKFYETQFEKILSERSWSVKRYEFKTELAFLVKK